MARRLAPLLTILGALVLAGGVGILALIPPPSIIALQERGFDVAGFAGA